MVELHLTITEMCALALTLNLTKQFDGGYTKTCPTVKTLFKCGLK